MSDKKMLGIHTIPYKVDSIIFLIFHMWNLRLREVK